MDKHEIEGLRAEAEALPATHPNLFILFQGLCVTCSEAELLRLREQIAETAEWLTQLVFRSQEYNIELAVELCERAVMLIDRSPQFPPQHKVIIGGAVKYLLFRNDVVPDMKAKDGLEDDRLIINYALCRLGLYESLVSANPKPREPTESVLVRDAAAVKADVSAQVRKEWKALRARMLLGGAESLGKTLK